MSQSNSDKFEKYRGTAGAEVKTTNVSGDDHPLKQELGEDDGAKERIYDAKIAGERFVQFYDDSAAAIREYLSNSETACIRRARHELLDAGFTKDEVPDEVSELLALAKEETGYEPLIEVTYNRKPDETRLIIEDNGIGISTEEYQVVQRIGYSTSHQEGSRLGNFGMGWMSGFQLTSVNGMFNMYTKSYLTDEAYGTVEYVANCEFLDAAPTEYGTRFEFPAFGEAAKNIDIPNKVAEFADGMMITVLYRDFDESGNETGHSDDFLATRMEDDYADDSMVVIYENDYFKAVMSPDSKESGRGTTTYNISMPIRRNTDKFGSSNKFNAPWKWDFRAKKENGPIVACESDESLVGLIPKENTKYDNLMPEMQEECIPMSQVPDDAVVMPEPASSRDSFKSGHDDFWRHVSQKLKESWASVAKQRFEELDSWDDFLAMERDEKKALFRAYSAFGPSYDDATRDTIHETLEDNLGVDFDKDLGKRLHESKSRVRIVRRGSSRAHTKGATTGKKIWKVIDEASDGVYMGKTISQKKADIAWGLGDTHVVRLDSGEDYDELASSWGWNKLKDLPHRNLEEKLPDLDQDIIDQYENVDASSSNNTSSNTGGNGQDPTTYRGKVRVGSNSRKYYSNWSVDKLEEKLEDGDEFKAGRYSCKYLIIVEDGVSARTVAKKANRHKDIAAMRVPKYVYNYLKGVNNVYESMDDLRDDKAGVELTLSDDTEMDIRDIPETDCILVTSSRIQREFEGREGDLLEALNVDDDFERYTWAEPNDFHGAWNAKTDATVIYCSARGSFRDFNDYTKKYTDYSDLLMKDRLGDVDKDSDEYSALFGYRHGSPSDSQMETLIKIAEEAGIPKN